MAEDVSSADLKHGNQHLDYPGLLQLEEHCVSKHSVPNAVFVGQDVGRDPVVAVAEGNAVVEARDGGGWPPGFPACTHSKQHQSFHQVINRLFVGATTFGDLWEQIG